MRITCVLPAPRHFMMAMESRRCWTWEWMAMATPMAPTMRAMRLMRERKVVERVSPRVMSGWVSRKSITMASGKASLSSWRRASTVLLLTAASGVKGNLKSKRWAARLPKRIRFVRSRPARDIIKRGPTLRLPAMRSGSLSTMAATRKSMPPTLMVSPSCICRRRRRSSLTAT